MPEVSPQEQWMEFPMPKPLQFEYPKQTIRLKLSAVEPSDESMIEKFAKNDFNFDARRIAQNIDALFLNEKKSYELRAIQSFLIKTFMDPELLKTIDQLYEGGLNAKNLAKVMEYDEQLIKEYLDLKYNQEPLSEKTEYADPIEYKTSNGWEKGEFFRWNDDGSCDIITQDRTISYNCKVDHLRSVEHISWKPINLDTPLPSGWRKMTVQEALQNKASIVPNLRTFEIALLDGGRVDGSGYGGCIHVGKFIRPSLSGKQICMKDSREEVQQMVEAEIAAEADIVAEAEIAAEADLHDEAEESVVEEAELDEELELELDTISIPPPPPPQLKEPAMYNIILEENSSSSKHPMSDIEFEFNDPIEYKVSNGWDKGNFFRDNGDNTCDIIQKNRVIKYNMQLKDIRSINHIKFKQIHLNTQIPSGWSKMSVEEAIKYKSHIMPTLSQWEIVLLDGGRIDGSAYGGQIHRGKFSRPTQYGRQYIINYKNKEVSHPHNEPIALEEKLEEEVPEPVIIDDVAPEIVEQAKLLADESIVSEDKIEPLGLDGKLIVEEQVDTCQGGDMSISLSDKNEFDEFIISEDKIYIVDAWTPKNKDKASFDFESVVKPKKPVLDGKKTNDITSGENLSILSQ